MSQTGSEDENESSSPTRKPLKQGATANRQAVSNMSVDISQTPSEKRAPSSRQEVKKQPAPNLQNMETSPSGGAVGGVLDLTVQSPPRAPPAPLDQKAKKGVKGGSSGPPKDQKSDVSKKKSKQQTPLSKR